MNDHLHAVRLPRFSNLPDVGLYLDQVVRFLNRSLEPLGLPTVTPSMVSNYVKKGYLSAPVRKQYSNEQLGRLMILVIGKNVLMMDNLFLLLQRWDADALPFSQRYDLYCDDFEQTLSAALEGRSLQGNATAGLLFHSLNTAAANIILLNNTLTQDSSVDLTIII